MVQSGRKVGNMRLHPAKDGLRPHPDERGMTRRDRGGNNLVDIVSPVSGYCTGVTSPLLSNGKHVITPNPTSGGKGDDFRYDEESARYYDLVRNADTDPYGLVVRLVSDGDEALPCTRVRVVELEKPQTSSMSGLPEKADKSLSDEKAKKRTIARKAREEQEVAVKAILASMDYFGPIDQKMRRIALVMLEMEKSMHGQDT